MTHPIRRAHAITMILCMLMATAATADIVASGSQPFTEPSGFYSGV